MPKQRKNTINWPLKTLVEVEWRDANAVSGWADLSSARYLTCPSCKTVGYLIHKTDKDILLADTQSPEHQGGQAQATGFFSIPTDWVGKITVLRK